MATEADIKELAKRIREKIANIPVSGGAYMALYQETFSMTVSAALLDKIAGTAAEVAAERNAAEPQEKTED